MLTIGSASCYLNKTLRKSINGNFLEEKWQTKKKRYIHRIQVSNLLTHNPIRCVFFAIIARLFECNSLVKRTWGIIYSLGESPPYVRMTKSGISLPSFEITICNLKCIFQLVYLSETSMLSPFVYISSWR